MMTQEEIDETNRQYDLDLTYDDYNFDLEKSREKKRKEKQRQENKDALMWWGMLIGASALMSLIFGCSPCS